MTRKNKAVTDTELIQAYQGIIHTLAFGLCKSKNHYCYDDLVQQGLISILRLKDRFTCSDAYLLQCCKRDMLTMYKRLTCPVCLTRDHNLPKSIPTAVELDESLPDKEEIDDQSELMTVIKDRVSRLPADERKQVESYMANILSAKGGRTSDRAKEILRRITQDLNSF